MSFLQQLLGKSDSSYSAEEAKTRLTNAIAQDRLSFSAEFLDKIKQSVVEALSKYENVDSEHVHLSVMREGPKYSIVTSIPIISKWRSLERPSSSSTARHQTGAKQSVRTKNSK